VKYLADEPRLTELVWWRRVIVVFDEETMTSLIVFLIGNPGDGMWRDERKAVDHVVQLGWKGEERRC
jgi:hypothetical protein